MKFGHEYQTLLDSGEFPQSWKDSAISYKQLKRCIKSVQKELTEIGLDPDTLRLVLQHANTTAHGSSSSTDDEELPNPVQYLVSGSRKPSLPKSNGEQENFIPKLVIAIDDATGEPVDARLPKSTRKYLHQLALSQGLADVNLNNNTAETASISTTESEEQDVLDANGELTPKRRPSRTYRMIELPLSANLEFLALITDKLKLLEKCEEEAEKHLREEVRELKEEISKVAVPRKHFWTRSDMDRWRHIFELYMEHQIYFGTREQDHGTRTAEQVEAKLKEFQAKLLKEKSLTSFKKKSSEEALEKFMHINAELLVNLKFLEINQRAINKILKKFDKRTALGLRTSFPDTIVNAALAPKIAESVTSTISNELITIAPSVEDYSCVLCCWIAWYPVRLRCKHYFCLRCMVKMQRKGDNMCPQCREPCIQDTNEDDLDVGFAKFLKTTFPDEVKEKRRKDQRELEDELFLNQKINFING